MIASLGGTYKIVCVSNSSVQWIIPNKKENTEVSISKSNDSVHILTISFVSSENAGLYTCIGDDTSDDRYLQFHSMSYLEIKGT